MKTFLSLIFLLVCGTDIAGSEPATHTPQSTPWFTGTLLPTRVTSLGKGHAVVKPCLYYTRYGGLYNDNWRRQSATTSQSLIQQTYFICVLTDSLDIEIAPQWIGTHARGDSSGNFGDLPLQVGVQVWRSPAPSWMPDVRLWIQEIVPTGRYSDLSPATADLERTGGGAYATTFGIAIQKAVPFGGEHVLRYRLNATYGIYSSVDVQGFNAYGGGFGTAGRVTPGSVATVTVAGEYSLTRHLVLALDIGFQTVSATPFSSAPGFDAQGRSALVGRGSSNLVTIGARGNCSRAEVAFPASRSPRHRTDGSRPSRAGRGRFTGARRHGAWNGRRPRAAFGGPRFDAREADEQREQADHSLTAIPVFARAAFR